MPAHRERELACARGSAGRPGSRQLHRLLGPPRSAGHFQHQQSPAPTSSLCSRAARSERAGAAAGAMSVAPRRACAPARGRRIKKPEKTTATEPTQSEWRWATTRKYAPGSLPKVGRSGTSARIALLQQVRLEGWSTRLSGRRKGGCGENGTYAPPEALDTNDGPQPARHGQQGRCRRS